MTFYFSIRSAKPITLRRATKLHKALQWCRKSLIEVHAEDETEARALLQSRIGEAAEHAVLIQNPFEETKKLRPAFGPAKVAKAVDERLADDEPVEEQSVLLIPVLKYSKGVIKTIANPL